MAALFRDIPQALENAVEIARRASLTIELGKSKLPVFPTPEGVTLEEHLGDAGARGPRAQVGEAVSGRRAARGRGDGLPGAAGFRAWHHRTDGFCGLLPDRRRFHQLGEEERRSGRPGARLGRRLAGGVLARHHRPRPDPLRPAVRALPQSGARLDAGLRHRFLPGRARPRDRVRAQQVRRRERFADRHLRHAGGARGGARLRPRARPRLQLLRPDRQAHSVPAGPHDHACRRARDGAAARRARAEGRRGQGTARARREARGPGAQCRHARGRGADRSRPARRILPAVCRRRDQQRHQPARQGRRRGDRAGEVRFPRPHHAHGARLGRALRARPGRRVVLARCDSARRQGDLPAARLGQRDRGVPVRIARHARPAQAGAAGALRGRDRAGGAVPAGADGTHPRLRRLQAGQEARRLRRSAPRADPGADLRHHGVPGTGDADRAGDRRLHARRRGPAAPRDGQEEQGGDGEAARRVRRGRDEERLWAGRRRRSCST